MGAFNTLGESVMHQQDRLLLSQLHLTFPPVWMEQGTEKARGGLIHRSSIIELHPQNRTRPNLAHKASANQRPSHH